MASYVKFCHRAATKASVPKRFERNVDRFRIRLDKALIGSALAAQESTTRATFALPNPHSRAKDTAETTAFDAHRLAVICHARTAGPYPPRVATLCIARICPAGVLH